MAIARLQTDQIKMARAREAEQLSLEFETARMARLGIRATPVGMSIEDNTAGYDIQSFDLDVSARPAWGKRTHPPTSIRSSRCSPSSRYCCERLGANHRSYLEEDRRSPRSVRSCRMRQLSRQRRIRFSLMRSGTRRRACHAAEHASHEEGMRGDATAGPPTQKLARDGESSESASG